MYRENDLKWLKRDEKMLNYKLAKIVSTKNGEVKVYKNHSRVDV